MSYVPLHCHSQYSILNAQPSLEDLVEKTKKEKMEAIALTDSGNLFGAVEFYQLCQKASIKPILGLNIHVAGDRYEKKRHALSFPILLLAKDQMGYKNLCKLSTIGYLEGFYYRPRIDWEILEKHREGLLCISGFLHSHLADGVLDKSEEEQLIALDQYQALFGEDFYINIERHHLSDLTNVEEVWLQELYKDHIQRKKKLKTNLVN